MRNCLNVSSHALRRTCSWGLAIAVCSLGTFSKAGDLDQSLAETLFEEGRVLMQEGVLQQACAKFAESQRVAPACGTLLNLGVCHEKLGQTASAWTNYVDAMRLAR